MPPHPQGNVIGESFPVDQNSKMRIVGPLRQGGWALLGPLLVLEVRRPPWPHVSRKGSLQVKVELCQGVFYSDAFLVKSILAKRRVCAQGGVLRHQIWTVNQVNHNDWPKENSEEMPHESNSNFHKSKTQQLRNSPWVCPCVYPHILYSFPLNKYFTCFTTLSLWKFFSEKLKARTWICAFPSVTQPNLWLGTQALLQVITSGGQLRSYLFDLFWQRLLYILAPLLSHQGSLSEQSERLSPWLKSLVCSLHKT